MDAALTLTLTGGAWSATIAPRRCRDRRECQFHPLLRQLHGAWHLRTGGTTPTPLVRGSASSSRTCRPRATGRASDGGIFNYGPDAPFFGSMGGQHLNAPMVGMAATPGGGGYREAGSDGGVFSFGNARFHGSTAACASMPRSSAWPPPRTAVYWLVRLRRRHLQLRGRAVVRLGGSLRLNKPIVGMAVTPDGHGYWLVASDGGIFSYGDAAFYGSRGGQPLNKPIVGIAASASDSATGSSPPIAASSATAMPPSWAETGSMVLNKPIVGMMGTFDGAGYWLTASDGGIFSYGDTGFYGSAGSIHLNAPVVSDTAS